MWGVVVSLEEERKGARLKVVGEAGGGKAGAARLRLGSVRASH